MYLDEIYNYLVASGQCGPSTVWPLYEGYIPDDSSPMVAIFPLPGPPPNTMARENQSPRFQLRVRSTRLDFPGVMAIGQTLYNLLQDAQEGSGGVGNLIGFTFIMAEHGGPMFFNDDAGRPNCTVNFRVMMQASVGNI